MCSAETRRGAADVSVPVLSKTTVSISARRSSAAVLDHDPVLEKPPRGHDLNYRHGKAERAGASDDQDGDGDRDCAMQSPVASIQPTNESKR